MTLVLKLDLYMVKMQHHTKNEVSMSTHSKVIAQTDRQTHRHDENITSTAYVGGKNGSNPKQSSDIEKMFCVLTTSAIFSF